MSTPPTLRFERALLRSGVTTLAAADEVGRGSLSGPVSIGMVVINLATRTAPQGVRDSKLLTPEARTRLVPKIQRWAEAHAVGHASPAEIDALGMTAALRLAGQRALAGLGMEVDAVLLDGKHDYLSDPAQAGLFGDLDAVAVVPPVHTKIKADLTCAAVAAASVLAKTERDGLMAQLHDQAPAYGWAINKGYASPTHLEALRVHGFTEHHRRSWTIAGINDETATPRPSVGLESAL